jgi:hypothetical protein
MEDRMAVPSRNGSLNRPGRSGQKLVSHIGGPLNVAMRQPYADDPTTGTGTKKPTEILGGLLSSCRTRFGRADRI